MSESNIEPIELPDELLDEIAGGNGCGIDPNG